MGSHQFDSDRQADDVAALVEDMMSFDPDKAGAGSTLKGPEAVEQAQADIRVEYGHWLVMDQLTTCAEEVEEDNAVEKAMEDHADLAGRSAVRDSEVAASSLVAAAVLVLGMRTAVKADSVRQG